MCGLSPEPGSFDSIAVEIFGLSPGRHQLLMLRQVVGTFIPALIGGFALTATIVLPLASLPVLVLRIIQSGEVDRLIHR